MRLLTIVAGLFATAWMLMVFPGSDAITCVNCSTRQGPMEQEARDVWEKAITAKGGRERLSQVRNIHITCRALRPYRRHGYKGLNAKSERLYVFLNKSWGWQDDRPSAFGLQIFVHNGERNVTWRATDDNPSHPAQYVANDADRYSSVQIQLIFFLETRWVKPVPLSVSQGTLAGKKVDVLHTDIVWDKDRAEYYLDAITHLPLKVVVHGPGPDGVDLKSTSIALGEYVSVNGIQMPTRKGVFDDDTIDSRILCSTEINVEYDETIFDHPPRIDDGPDAWRPHRKP